MEEIKKLTTEVVNLRSDVLYLVRLIEKMDAKLVKLEQAAAKPNTPVDPFAGKQVERL